MAITITRTNTRTWEILDVDPNITVRSDVYTCVNENELFSISSIRGGILLNNRSWTEFNYVDLTDSDNDFTPTSARDLFERLNELDGFFLHSSEGGGGSGFDKLKELLDVNIPTFAGQLGKVLLIGASGKVELGTGGGVTSITQLQEWITGNALQANKFLGTNSNGTKIIQGDIELVVNTPIAVDEFRVVAKGTQGGVPNVEPYVKEIGDFCEGVSSTNGRKYRLIYKGGDEADIANYEIRGWSEPLTLP